MTESKSSAVTRSDNLRIGIPFWVHTPHSTLEAQVELPATQFDVVVIGAGISGALMAEALTAMNKSVLILDYRPAARGSTAASTAMIQHEIDVPLCRLAGQIGEDKAARAWLRSVKAVGDLAALTATLKLNCGIEQKSALYISGDDLGSRGLKAEAEARQKIGIEATYLNAAELRKRFNIERSGAILSQDSSSANPAQLTTGLLRAALKRKAYLCSPVKITDFVEFPSGVALATENGKAITADFVVFCTGYEFLARMQTPSHHLTSTWAIASEPLNQMPDWLKHMVAWEASDPYLYFRAAGRRIIVGGEDEESSSSNSDPTKLKRKAQAIASKFQDLTGVDIGKPAYSWAAPFSVTDDGLPIFDRVPGCDRVFAIMGFGGNGITFSVIGAQIVAAEIIGKPDVDAQLFRFR